ncbi:MAG: BNR-4 repeat-containing protein [Sedimentisphaerales bacterium]|nr:BNR-4 repeat-containing protein [Sedimentisphaerales bacterium]
MKKTPLLHALIISLFILPTMMARGDEPQKVTDPPDTLNKKDTGYRGVWYYNEKLNNEYVYKYSGGLGTYCAKHRPFAVYSPKVNKTFFCYGGARKGEDMQLVHMVSYFDHNTGMVSRPTILLDKHTTDAHDNPVISMDDDGYIWIFSTAHGTRPPAFIHRSARPYDIDEFVHIPATRVTDEDETVEMNNFSYFQPWYISGKGFMAFFTRYHYPAGRTICYMTSPDGKTWSKWNRIAAIQNGSYQISLAQPGKAATIFDFHPTDKGVNYRTNLYYLETTDSGKTWQTADGQKMQLPITEVQNPALVHDYQAENLLVYVKDLRFDDQNHPILLYTTSKGFESGPENDPRIWWTARWTGEKWEILPAMRSGNNYDMGPLYLEPGGIWRIIAPTELGPQPYNTGGEIAMWLSKDKGHNWIKIKQMTCNSLWNHSFVRHPVNANPEFYALWADGHSRQPSGSHIYFCDIEGNVYRLPPEMKADFEKPQLIPCQTEKTNETN